MTAIGADPFSGQRVSSGNRLISGLSFLGTDTWDGLNGNNLGKLTAGQVTGLSNMYRVGAMLDGGVSKQEKENLAIGAVSPYLGNAIGATATNGVKAGAGEIGRFGTDMWAGVKVGGEFSKELANYAAKAYNATSHKVTAGVDIFLTHMQERQKLQKERLSNAAENIGKKLSEEELTEISKKAWGLDVSKVDKEGLTKAIEVAKEDMNNPVLLAQAGWGDWNVGLHGKPQGLTDGNGNAVWDGGKVNMTKNSQEVFIKSIEKYAQDTQKDTGVPASITIAQAILETGWGKHTISGANNFFGVKGQGPAGSVIASTTEEVNGKYITIKDEFRKYNTMGESFIDHAKVITEKIPGAMQYKDDPKKFAGYLEGRYATDSQYAEKLINIMDKYNLYQYNK